jgi:hypothetical protein
VLRRARSVPKSVSLDTIPVTKDGAVEDLVVICR